MKNYRTIAVIFYLCSVAFYILAAINLFTAESGTGFTFLGIGSMWLCLGALYSHKSQNEDGDSDNGGK